MFGLLRQEPDAALGTSLSVVDTDIKPLRRVRACTTCRNRKLKCSLARPQCNRCETQKITCHYPEAGDSSKREPFTGAEVTRTLDKAKDSSSTTDEASLKRKRVKKVHSAFSTSSQSKSQTATRKDEIAPHGTVIKKERSKSPKSSTGSHQLSLHPPPTPISPTITGEDHEDNQNIVNDGSWINHLLLYTPGEGLETCVDTMDMMGMTSPWLDFTADDLGGTPATGKNEAVSNIPSATGQQHCTKPLSPVESADSIISPVDESLGLGHYFTDPTDSHDMLLQSPAYTDLLLSNISTFPGNENWTWDQHNMNSLDLLTPMSSVSPFQTAQPSSSDSPSSDSSSSSTWSPSSENAGMSSSTCTSVSSPSYLFPTSDEPTTRAMQLTSAKPMWTNTHSTKATATTNTSSSSQKKSKHHMHRSKTPSPARQAAHMQGCYETHITPLHQALEKLQISSFSFLQSKSTVRSRNMHTHKSKNRPKQQQQKKDSPPPYDTLLKSQKQALLACGALLGCQGCSSWSDLVMLVISVCGLFVGSLEGLNTHNNNEYRWGINTIPMSR